MTDNRRLSPQLRTKAREAVAELNPLLAPLGLRLTEPAEVGTDESHDDETVYGLSLFVDLEELRWVDVRSDVRAVVSLLLAERGMDLLSAANELRSADEKYVFGEERDFLDTVRQAVNESTKH